MALHKAPSPEVAADPARTARFAGLRYVKDGGPGITRRRTAKGFRYVGIDGAPLRDAESLARIRALAIPPAWEEVWICPLANGHLQATGKDARGRKQYRYHPTWHAVRDATKYTRMIAFGEKLPGIRAQVDADMRRTGLPREKVIATVVHLLDTTYIRVGNEEYAKDNRSYGLTTMRSRHVDVEGGTVRFEFRGKSGKDHAIDLHDPRTARIVAKCQDLPGQELFQYLDEAGERHHVESADVNDYLHTIAGDDFTAKDFRTWAGTVLAAWALQELGPHTSEREAKRHVVEAIERVAKSLGNTPAVCRKCYVHPAVLDGHLDGTLLELLTERVEEEVAMHPVLDPQERAVMRFLRARVREVQRSTTAA